MDNSSSRDIAAEHRLSDSIRAASTARLCDTCAHRKEENQGGSPIAICGREETATPCAEARASTKWPGCGPSGAFWAWHGSMTVPDLPTPQQSKITPASSDRATEADTLRWSDLLLLANAEARDVAALTALMWQAASNWDDGKVAIGLVFQAAISPSGIADTLDFHRVPVLPAALAVVRGVDRRNSIFPRIGLG